MRVLSLFGAALLASVAGAAPARFCVTSDEASSQCQTVVDALGKFSDDFVWGCVHKESAPQCFAALQAGEAEMQIADGAEIYEGHKYYDLKVLVQENYEGANEGKEYWAVAVVRSDVCDQFGEDMGLDKLQGLSSCHTGYRRTAGWWAPLGVLASEGVLTSSGAVPNNLAPDAVAMADFFKDTCATGLSEEGPPAFDATGNATYYSQLCAACKENCTTNDQYNGYGGAMLGLYDGACDVAFTKHSAPLDFTTPAGGSTEYSIGDYKLVCKSGGCKDLDEFKSCNLAEVPAHAMVVHVNLTDAAQLQQVLVDASKDEETAKAMFGDENEDFWGEETANLSPVGGDVDSYLGDMYKAYEALYANQWVGVHADYRGNDAVYCLPYPSDNAMVKICNDIFALAEGNGVTFKCVSGDGPEGCMEMIVNGTADFTTLDTADVYVAETNFGLLPLAAEVYGDDGAAYYSVALVHKSLCDAFGEDVKLENLKGLKSCHTGYSRMTGWTAPLGYMIDEGIIPAVGNGSLDILDDAEAVAAFFNTTCAPRTGPVGPKIGEDGSSQLWDDLCIGCKGNCTEHDPYYDYRGAVRCLMEGGDVAFTKHSAALEYAMDGEEPQEWSSLNKDQLRLLCRSGGCKEIEQYKECNLAEVPGHAVVGRADWADSDGLKQLLAAANDADNKFLHEATEMEEKVEAGRAEESGEGEHSELPPGFEGIFEEGVTELRALDTSEDYLAPVRSDIQAVHRLSSPSLKWCVHSEAEMAFCEENIGAINDAQEDARFACYLPEDKDCFAAINAGDAHLTVGDSYDVYNAWKQYGIQPVAVQQEGEEEEEEGHSVEDGIEYYAVAVVRKELCDEIGDGIKLGDLKDKKMCSTGYQRTAGWVAPLGFMVQSEELPVQTSDGTVQPDAQSAASFFGEVCAARVINNGPMKSEDGLGERWEPMCSACEGDCTEQDAYYSYNGAMRCLMEGGDVAFTKHTSPEEYALDGKEPQEWSSLNKEDMRLVCPSRGGCKPIDEWSQCRIVGIPAHAVVMAGGSPYAGSVRVALQAIPADPTVQEAVFNEKSNPEGLMLEAGTAELKPVYSTPSYFGDAVRVFDAFALLEPPSAEAAGRR